VVRGLCSLYMLSRSYDPDTQHPMSQDSNPDCRVEQSDRRRSRLRVRLLRSPVKVHVNVHTTRRTPPQKPPRGLVGFSDLTRAWATPQVCLLPSQPTSHHHHHHTRAQPTAEEPHGQNGDGEAPGENRSTAGSDLGRVLLSHKLITPSD
jgi:hypothetical protein